MTHLLLTIYAIGLLPSMLLFATLLERQRYYAPAAVGAFMAIGWPVLIAYVVVMVTGGFLRGLALLSWRRIAFGAPR